MTSDRPPRTRPSTRRAAPTTPRGVLPHGDSRHHPRRRRGRATVPSPRRPTRRRRTTPSGTGLPAARAATAGTSTPATATTAACSSPPAPGARYGGHKYATPGRQRDSRAEQIEVARRVLARAGPRRLAGVRSARRADQERAVTPRGKEAARARRARTASDAPPPQAGSTAPGARSTHTPHTGEAPRAAHHAARTRCARGDTLSEIAARAPRARRLARAVPRQQGPPVEPERTCTSARHLRPAVSTAPRNRAATPAPDRTASGPASSSVGADRGRLSAPVRLCRAVAHLAGHGVDVRCRLGRSS